MIPNLLEPVLLTQRFQLKDQLLYKARVINLLQAESRALKFTITAKNSLKKNIKNADSCINDSPPRDALI